MFWVPVGAQGGNHFLQEMKKDTTVSFRPLFLPPPSGNEGGGGRPSREGSGDNRKYISVGGRTSKEFGVKEGKQERQDGVG